MDNLNNTQEELNSNRGQKEYIPKAYKKKMPIWKKIFIAFLVLFVISVMSGSKTENNDNSCNNSNNSNTQLEQNQAIPQEPKVYNVGEVIEKDDYSLLVCNPREVIYPSSTEYTRGKLYKVVDIKFTFKKTKMYEFKYDSITVDNIIIPNHEHSIQEGNRNLHCYLTSEISERYYREKNKAGTKKIEYPKFMLLEGEQINKIRIIDKTYKDELPIFINI